MGLNFKYDGTIMDIMPVVKDYLEINKYDVVHYAPEAGYILTEINEQKITSTSELSTFENENIYQITFIDLNGEKERLIFD